MPNAAVNDGNEVVLDNPLAQRTFNTIIASLKEGKTACIIEIVRLIKDMSSNYDKIVVNELAEMIGRDVSLTVKIISAANRLGHNPRGVQVKTITEAIHVVGFHTIKNLAISLLLAENAESSGIIKPEDQREVSAFALCSGLLAEAIARQTNTQSAEVMFVCSTLRSYGKLVLATFLMDDFRRAHQLIAQGVSEDKAYTETFGLTPLKLTHAMLKTLNLPESILCCFKPVTAGMIQSPNKAREEELIVLSELSEKLCVLAESVEHSQEDFKLKSSELIEQYGQSAKISEAWLREAMLDVANKMEVFNSTYGIKSFSSTFMKKISSRASGHLASASEIIQGPAAEETKKTPLVPAAVEGRLDSLSEQQNAVTSLQEGLLELVESLTAVPPCMEKVLTIVIKTLHKALGIESGLLFSKDPGNPLLYSARYGRGPLFLTIRDKPLINPLDKNIFGICFSRGEDIVVQSPADPKIRPFIPEWLFPANKGSAPMVFLPIKDGNGVFSLYCGVSAQPRILELTPMLVQQLKTIRSQIGLAVRLGAKI